MKKIAVLILSIFSASLFAQAKARVHVTYTNSYCGGARPTPEIEQEVKVPLEFTKATLLLVGKRKKKVKTDGSARFTASLKPGKYQVRLTKARPAPHATNYDPSCKKMLTMSYGELIVTKGVHEYELNLHFPCNPCGPPRE